MKRILKFIYVAVFFIVCCLPLCLWTWFSTEESVGNTKLEEFPKLTDENGGFNFDFTSQFDTYFAQHLPFRPELISVDAKIKSGLLAGDSGNVIVGEDGMLFSKDTLDDYLGLSLSDRDIYSIAKTVKLIQDYSQSMNSDFVFVPMPNKNTVYPEYMPSRYVKGESGLLKLYDTLDELEVNYINMTEVFEDAKDLGVEERLYHDRDTHWNYLGAFYGYNALMENLGKDGYYDDITMETRVDWQGDLDSMMYPRFGSLDTQYYLDVPLTDYMIIKPFISGWTTEQTMQDLMSSSEKNDSTINTVNENKEGKLLMCRDSFARAWLPYLADSYNSTDITRYYPINLTSLNPDEDTDVVYEIVERNLENVISDTPNFDMSPVEKSFEVTVEESDKNTSSIDTLDGRLKIYGELSPEYFEYNSDIYVVFEGENGNLVYEAFPISTSGSQCGYSLYVNTDDFGKGIYNMSVVISDKNGDKSTGTLTEITFE